MRFVPVIIGTVTLFSIPIAAQSVLTYPEYEKQLAEQLSRDQKYREMIAQEQSLITDYKKKISESKKRISELQRKKFEVLGISESDAESCLKEITRCFAELNNLQAITDDRLYESEERFNDVQRLYSAITQKPASRLPDLRKRVSSAGEMLVGLERRINAYKEELDRKKSEKVLKKNVSSEQVTAGTGSNATTYKVSKIPNNPETLFSIARKVYGDPNRWPEIYQANQEALDRNFKAFGKKRKSSSIVNPSDLILPGQELIIPR